MAALILCLQHTNFDKDYILVQEIDKETLWKLSFKFCLQWEFLDTTYLKASEILKTQGNHINIDIRSLNAWILATIECRSVLGNSQCNTAHPRQVIMMSIHEGFTTMYNF